ncbi:TPA: pyrroloquinoline quinone biosynthesis protein PqqF [Enterobacter hormaechei]|nr:pyrroloquinoline quinone biosynthesis protein PqqF [Enterobacter hormaechei]
MTTRIVELAGGLRATLVHQPQATRAAALARVSAGSHHEPPRFAGLAHLLEHLLFRGSQRYQGDDRLMAWVQRQGGSVNATTLARHSAFFFDVAADNLSDGVARLRDMLQAPLLSRHDIQREVAVIDAENRLIQQHDAARREAAARHAMEQPAVFRRFQVGSKDSLGQDTVSLQTALRDFHRRYYVAGHLQLWLQGPQTLDALAELARTFASGFTSGGTPETAPPLRLSAEAEYQLAVTERPALWRCPLIRKSDNVTLLREFLLDDAPGSLIAELRTRGLAEEVALSWLYQDDEYGWLALTVDGERPEDIDPHITHWLRALQQTTDEQQRHYYRLAQRRFSALPTLEQLRQRAFGFAPGAAPAGFSAFCADLLAAPVSYLTCKKMETAEIITSQGFALPLSPWHRQPVADDSPIAFSFYPQAARYAAPAPASEAAPLLHLSAQTQPPTLILRRPFYSRVERAQGVATGKQLRPLLAELRHIDGSGEWQAVDGSWQLTLRLPDVVVTAERIIGAIIERLAHPTLAITPAPEGIAIRELLQQLPERLASDLPRDGWLAALAGGSAGHAHRLARQLSLLGAPVNATPTPLEGCPGGIEHIPHASADSALLVFIPLPPGASLAALRLLALCCEPQFFQRLRVEQQIGYVVSCRYQRIADRDGLLLALQSPDRSPLNLLGCCKRFLRELTLCDEATFSVLRQQLATQIRSPMDASATAVAALRQRYGLPVLTPQAIDALQPDEIIALWREMTRRRRRWRVLFTG